MTTIYANRACGILYRILSSRDATLPYLLPANVCPVVPLTFLSAGAKFRFIDINPTTLCIDETLCTSEITNKRYAGMVFVRTYGHVYDTSDFFNRIKTIDDSFMIIDDRCLSKPSFSYDDNNADVQLYSTGYAKYVNLGKFGFARIKNDTIASLATNVDDIPFSKEIDIENIYKEKAQKGEIIEKPIDGWLDTRLMPNVEKEKYKVNVVN